MFFLKLDLDPLVTPGLGLILWMTLAFGIVLFLLTKYAWKPILKAVQTRENNIQESIDSAEKVKAEMAQMKSENQDLLAKAREERALMLKEAKETRDKMVNDAKEAAKTEANKIMVDAQAAIQSQKMAALIDVKNQVGNLVIEVSEKILKRELSNKGEHETYIKQLTEGVKLN
jgi:F-type H+-transporting ATPase subunit b